MHLLKPRGANIVNNTNLNSEALFYLNVVMCTFFGRFYINNENKDEIVFILLLQ